MNIERVHNILFVLNSGVDEIDLMTLLNALNSHLTHLTDDPSNADHQKNAAEARIALLSALSNSNTSRFPNSWVQALEEMGLDCFLASNIELGVSQAYQGNDITPAAVQEKIHQLTKTLSQKKEITETFISTVTNLDVGKEELGDAESEITFEVPHEAIDSNAEKFADQIKEFVDAFQPFYIMVAGGAAEIEIKSISSSRLTVTLKFAGAITAVALAVSAVSEAIVDVMEVYEAVQEYRTMKNQLQSKGDSAEEVIRGLEVLTDQEVNQAIENSVDKLWDTYGRPDETEANINDVKTRLRFGIRALAKKLDSGYSVETRMGELPPPETVENEDGEHTPVDDPDRARLFQAFEKISSAHHKQLMFEVEGEPILHLPNADDDPTS